MINNTTPRRPEVEEDSERESLTSQQFVRGSMVTSQADSTAVEIPEEVPEPRQFQRGEPVSLEPPTLRDAARQLPELTEEALRDYVPDDNNREMTRARSALNSFMLGLTEVVPGAIKTKAILDTRWKNFVSDLDIKPEYSIDYLVGQAIGDKLEELFPEDPEHREEFWAGMVARGAGQMTAQVLATFAGVGIAGLGARGAFALNTLYTSALGSEYYNEALAEGASEDTAFGNMILNIVGVSGLNALPFGLALKRINEGTGRSLSRVMKSGFKGSVQEGVTEGLQQWYSNMLAINMYDSTRDMLDGVIEGVAVGGLLGFTAGASMSALMDRRMKATSPEQVLEIDRTAKMLEAVTDDTYDGVTRYDMDELASRLSHVSRAKQIASETVANDNVIAEPKAVQTIEGRGKWKKWVDKQIHWYPMRKRAGIIMQEAQARVAHTAAEAEINAIRLNKAILDHYGVSRKGALGFKSVSKAIEAGTVPETLPRQIDQALKNPEALADLPQSLQEPVNVFRKHIDKLSEDMKRAGFNIGKYESAFKAETGPYVHRSYKLYDPNFEWTENTIPPDLWNRTMNIFEDIIKAEFKETGINADVTEANIDAYATIEAERRMRQILAAKGEGSIANLARVFNAKAEYDSNGVLLNDGADTNILKERQDIPGWLREFMGEHVDGTYNYLTTVEKMAGTLERRKMFDKLADEFTGDLFLNRDQRLYTPEPHKYKQIDTQVGSKLDRLYMHEDLLEAFQMDNATRKYDGWLRHVYKYNLATKMAKTLYSHVAVIRNITGGMLFLTSQGHLFNAKSWSPAWQAAQLAFSRVHKLDQKGLHDKYLDLIELDMYGKSVTAGVLKDSYREAFLEKRDPFLASNNFITNIATLGQARAKGAKGLLKQANDVIAAAYQGGDDFLRIWMYEVEKARYEQNGVNKTDREVAQVVHDLYQNYDRVGRLAHTFRKVPVISPFVSFFSEVGRIMANTGIYIREGLNSSDPGERKIARQRLAGAFTTVGGILGAATASQITNGITDDDDQAFRSLMPEWDARAILIYTSTDDGIVRYINTSYINPYAYFIDPITALIKGEPHEDVFKRSLNSVAVLFEPILGEEIFTMHLTEALSGKKRNGGEVWNPQDSLGDKISKSLTHLWAGFEPGTVSSVRRAVESFDDPDNPGEWYDELAGLMGVRIITMDVRKSLGFRIRDYREDIRDTRRIYTSAIHNDDASLYDETRAFRYSNQRYEELFNEMSLVIEGAQRSGVDWKEIDQMMRDSGLASRDRDALRRGVFTPFDP